MVVFYESEIDFSTFVFFIFSGNKCYKLGGRKRQARVSWDRALERCRSLGGDLVSIGSQQEQGNNLHLAIALALERNF